ncbi:hypothetical protein [Citrobacter pasteurii]|nr:hypothetical protein [Citrobacter pasteurii]
MMPFRWHHLVLYSLSKGYLIQRAGGMLTLSFFVRCFDRNERS